MQDLFNSDIQELAVDLNEMGSLKLSINVHWMPFVGEDIKLTTANLRNDISQSLKFHTAVCQRNLLTFLIFRQHFDFYLNLIFFGKILTFTKISMFGQNFNFTQTYIFRQNFYLYQYFALYQNFYFY